MKHAVKIFNYLKGTYEAALFNKKKDAIKCFDLMKTVEYAEDDELAYAVNQAALKKCIAYEEDLPAIQYGNAEVVKEFGFSVNEDGFVHPEISDITFVNNGSYITVPA